MTDFLTDDVSSLVVIEKLSPKNLNDSFFVDEKFDEYKDFLYFLLYKIIDKNSKGVLQ